MYRSTLFFAGKTVFNNKWAYLALAVLGCLTLSSCVGKPELIRVDDLEILGIRDSVLSVRMVYVVYNPNIFKAKISQAGVEVFFDREKLGDASIDEPVALPARDTSRVPMEVILDLNRLESVYPDLVEQDSAVFRIQGEHTVRFLTGNLKLKVDEAILLNTQQLIQEQVERNLSKEGTFAIESIGIRQLPSLSNLILNVKVGIRNDLPLDFAVQAANLRFYTDKKTDPIADWQLDEPLVIAASSRITLPAEVELQNFNILRDFDLSWISRGGIALRVEGTAQIGINEHSFNIPIKQKKVVSMRGFPSLFE